MYLYYYGNHIAVKSIGRDSFIVVIHLLKLHAALWDHYNLYTRRHTLINTPYIEMKFELCLIIKYMLYKCCMCLKSIL